MIVGVPQETCPGERRVALTPAGVATLKKSGLDVVIQAGSGEKAGFADAAYREKGARIEARREDVFSACAVILQVRSLGANLPYWEADLSRYRPGQALIGFLDPLAAPRVCGKFAERGTTALALELMPRIARAQTMDALSSMATVAGYKAVLLAATNLPRMFPMLTTAAGTITPARVLVIGAGVAGLQAIATARRLGAAVKAYDVRPAAKQDVLSLGAAFVELSLEVEAPAEDERGYARDLGDEFYRRQRELLSRAVAESDVVITTASVPGKKAPILITGQMIEGMAPGSIIVDVAAERGGNCELSRVDEVVVQNGVTIFGPANLPSTVPYHASQMFSKNISTFFLHLMKDGELALHMEDPIVRETLVVREGRIVHPRVLEAIGSGPERGNFSGRT